MRKQGPALLALFPEQPEKSKIGPLLSYHLSMARRYTETNVNRAKELLMLTDQQVQQFRQDGFLSYGEKVLTDDELDALRVALKRTLDDQSESAPDAKRNIGGSDTSVVTQIVNIWEAEPAFAAHLYNDRIVPMVAQLMGGAETVRVWHDQIQIKPPHIGGPTIWHQDFPYWPIIAPSDLISAWVALEDADEENGCMSMVRKSHSWDRIRDRTAAAPSRTPRPTDPPTNPRWFRKGRPSKSFPVR
jgi:ectoine hydroxylase-related dioxygenase (phytanoyl-CoA dioxygenase family)